MTTLNEIADYICGKLGQPFNELLKDEVKFAIKNQRALILRRDSERNLTSPIFYQSPVIELIRVDEIDSCKVELGCKILRSKEKVPVPIRRKSPAPFELVSSASVRGIKDIYPYKTREEVPLLKHTKYQSEIIGYDYINLYIYVYANKLLKWLRLKDIFESVEEINICATNETCYTDDSPFPCSKDVVQGIIDAILNTEIKLANRNLEVTTQNLPVER